MKARGPLGTPGESSGGSRNAKLADARALIREYDLASIDGIEAKVLKLLNRFNVEEVETIIAARAVVNESGNGKVGLGKVANFVEAFGLTADASDEIAGTLISLQEQANEGSRKYNFNDLIDALIHISTRYEALSPDACLAYL